jgi:hypothetical protein
MNTKLLTAVVAAAFVSVSAASWAQVAAGGNVAPKYGTVEASKNRKVLNHGVGGNSAPTYAKVEASKNKKVVNHGVGGNSAPIYPKVGIH